MTTHVMWFRKDLRLDDNTALRTALFSLDKHDELLCVFQLNPTQFKTNTLTHDYFFSTLYHFAEEAKNAHLPIHFLVGEPQTSFLDLKKQFPSWDTIYFNSDDRGYGQQRDTALIDFFHALGLTVIATEDAHLHQASAILKNDGTPYQKFTPYYKKWRKLDKPLVHSFKKPSSTQHIVDEPALFEEGQTAFNALLVNMVSPSNKSMPIERLNWFTLHELERYHIQRDIPSIDGTSRLSPYLSTGQLSIRQVWHAAFNSVPSDGRETFLKELCWRDFYHMIYHFNPNQARCELKDSYQSLPWRQECPEFERWKQGNTGFPIIDAAMRQLNQTGWMHNRLRMLVASFLTKDLLIDWRLGEQYFATHLIDYDSASNIGGWQWAASTGTDAVPYFRLFNPTTQGKKFDATGVFIRQFIPELRHVPDTHIHEPHLLTSKEKKEYCSESYPDPIVDHKYARERALEWFRTKRK